MIITNVKLKNWRNFQSAEVSLGRRVFLVGPNASGKSNFLDVFRFLHDIALEEGGGLKKAIKDHGGIKKIRCLSARRETDIEIQIKLAEDINQPVKFQYEIGIHQENSGARRILLRYERVWKDNQIILNRPNENDKRDPDLLTETHLEQISRNENFREIAKFLKSVLYLHLVPQLIKYSRQYSGPGIPGDPYGRNFLERISSADLRIQKSRLHKIEKALKKVVPQLNALRNVIDKKEGGAPHLEVDYEHWRQHGARQREADFSDGTLRLIGLFWTLLEGESLLLLEEPEISLNAEIIRKLPELFYRLTNSVKKKRQIIVSTHSWELLSEKGIGGEETLLLIPGEKGTDIKVASSIAQVRILLENGLSVAEAVMPKTAPKNICGEQLDLPF